MKDLKKLNAKLKCQMAGAHTLSHEISAFIYIYVLVDVLYDVRARYKFIFEYYIRNCLYDHAT